MFCYHGGGRELIQEAFDTYAGGGVKVVGCGAIARESFTSKIPIRGIEDLKGVKVRSPEGLAAIVFERAGASPVALPASEVHTSIDKGVVDAADFSSYSMDESVGLHEIAKFPIYPGIHSMPVIQFTVNKAAYDSLTPAQQTILDVWYRAMIADLAMMNEITDRELVARDMAEGSEVEVINWSKEDRDAARDRRRGLGGVRRGRRADQARLRGQHRVHEEDRAALSPTGAGARAGPGPDPGHDRPAEPSARRAALLPLPGGGRDHRLRGGDALRAQRPDLVGVRARPSCLCAICYLMSGGYVTEQRKHIAITALYDILPARARWWLDLLGDADRHPGDGAAGLVGLAAGGPGGTHRRAHRQRLELAEPRDHQAADRDRRRPHRAAAAGARLAPPDRPQPSPQSSNDS